MWHHPWVVISYRGLQGLSQLTLLWRGTTHFYPESASTLLDVPCKEPKPIPSRTVPQGVPCDLGEATPQQPLHHAP